MSKENSTPTIVTPGEPPRTGRRRAVPPPAESPWTIVVSTAEAPEPDADQYSLAWWKRRTLAWIRSASAAGTGISLALHAILILMMSLVVFHELSREDSIRTSITETDDDLEMLDDVTDVQIDMPAGAITTATSLETAMKLETSDLVDSPVMSGVEDSLENLFEKEGAGGAGGGGFRPPQNARVFKKGSFSVWTVPNDPGPGQDYEIVIVVKLPTRVTKYRATDLSGIVVGTDGYRKTIPELEYTRGRVYLPLEDHTAQMIVKVPGGVAKVRDRIDIRSTTLNEQQTIFIEF